MNKTTKYLIYAVSVFTSFPVVSDELAIKITREISSVEVIHQGKPVKIQRNQNAENRISDDFALTSHPCPPHCIQPMKLAPGVETIGELEILSYLGQIQMGNKQTLVVDTRSQNWFRKGTIPGSVNVPWSSLNPDSGADPISIGEILENQFNAIELNDGWDFSNAKTLVLFCNGMWCEASPKSIKKLITIGYPAEKLKWYRGGMQTWETLGLTTVKSNH